MNAAPSNKTAVVSSVISEFKPPITPAKAIDFSPSVITNILSSRVLSTLSSVVNFSPFSAVFTTILPVLTWFKSKACSG